MMSLNIFVAYTTFMACLQIISCSEFEQIGNLVGQSVALVVGQEFVDDKSVPKAFKEYAMNDDTNEDLGRACVQDLITRAGFQYENHYVVADDGYVTQLTRIVNPLADQDQLKQPPVMLLQGGITDVTIWIWGSVAQHHPEKYPRTAQDGLITSWNRSLAFTLSNNGYDVWLVSHRGANDQNQGHVDLKNKHSLPGKKYQKSSFNENMASRLNTKNRQLSMDDMLNYWDYTMDDIAAYEVPRHIDKVLSVTGAKNVTFVPMSFSTIYALMALARNPSYQDKIHNTVVVGPIINNIGTNRLMKVFHSTLCKLVPFELGTMLADGVVFTQQFREISLLLGERKDWRYAVLAPLMTSLAGPSPRFQTLLEPAVYGHILMPTGFKMIKHYCQVVSLGKMRRYDHGAIQNKKLYGNLFAPDYPMDVVNFGNWMIVSAENDVLATQKSVKHYIHAIKPKPFEHVYVKGYNHLDLWAAIDNDVKINMPILGFLDNFHLAPRPSQTNPSNQEFQESQEFQGVPRSRETRVPLESQRIHESKRRRDSY